MHVQTSCLGMASNTCVARCSSQRVALPLAPAHAPMPPAVLPAPTCNRYILWAAEEEGYDLPYACRLGCCTACTVKVKEGEVYQPHSLGLSKNLRDQVGQGVVCGDQSTEAAFADCGNRTERKGFPRQ